MIKLTAFFILSITAFPVSAAENQIEFSVPKTLSAVSVLEMNGRTIAGKKIHVSFYDDQILAMSSFVSNKTDVFLTGFSIGLSYYRSSKNAVLVANPIWGMSSVVTGQNSYSKLSDLKGKTILVPFQKSPLDLQLRELIRRQGLNDIRIEYAPIPQQLPLILAGRADAGCLPEPFPSMLVAQKKGKRVFSMADAWASVNNGEKRTPQVALFVKKEKSDLNKAFLDAFTEQLQAECASVQKNKTALSKKYAKVFDLDEAVLAEGIGSVIYEIPAGASEKKLITDYQKAIGDQENIGDDFFRNRK